jgi:hypothetical protein
MAAGGFAESVFSFDGFLPAVCLGSDAVELPDSLVDGGDGTRYPDFVKSLPI